MADPMTTTTTRRKGLRALAHRQRSFKNMDVSDELTALSPIPDRLEREGEFSALCEAIALGSHHRAERILTVLTGGAA